MKTASLLAATLLVTLAGLRAEMSEKEVFAVANRVMPKVERGDVDALEELKTLPRDYAVVLLLNQFRQNQNVYNGTDLNKQIARKAAALVTEVPEADVYLLNLFGPHPKPHPDGLRAQVAAAIGALKTANNKFAARVLCTALASDDLEADPAAIMNALSKMNLPAAPPNSDRSKWISWWQEHKSAYTE